MFRQTIESVAGYALTRPEPEFGRLRDACHACAPLVPTRETAPNALVDEVKVIDAPVDKQYRPRTVTVLPAEACEVLGVVSCTQGGSHKFDLRTHLCCFCGQRYRDLRGREPELMTRSG